MRQWVSAAVVAALAAGVVAPARAEVKSVTGELVTIMCYTKNGDKGRGDAHAACAQKCAKGGYPVAVLSSDGTLYKIIGKLTAEKNEQLQPLLAKTVVVTGELGEEGRGKTIDAESVTAAK